MSGIFKAANKVRKKVFKGARKAFKAVTSSTIGKVLVGAALIYLGGAAFGAWQSPFASVNGAFTAAGSQASQAAAVGQSAATGAEAAGTLDAASAGLSESLGTATGNNLGLAGAEGSLSGVVNPVGLAAQGGGISAPLLTPGVNTGILNSAINPTVAASTFGSAPGGVMGAVKGAGSFVKSNPLLAAIGINTAASMSAADDAAKEEEKLRKRREKNLNVGDIDLGVSPGGAQAGNPSGFINSRLRA